MLTPLKSVAQSLSVWVVTLELYLRELAPFCHLMVRCDRILGHERE